MISAQQQLDGQMTMFVVCGFVLAFAVWSLVRHIISARYSRPWARLRAVNAACRHDRLASRRAVASREKRRKVRPAKQESK